MKRGEIYIQIYKFLGMKKQLEDNLGMTNFLHSVASFSIFKAEKKHSLPWNRGQWAISNLLNNVA